MLEMKFKVVQDGLDYQILKTNENTFKEQIQDAAGSVRRPYLNDRNNSEALSVRSSWPSWPRHSRQQSPISSGISSGRTSTGGSTTEPLSRAVARSWSATLAETHGLAGPDETPSCKKPITSASRQGSAAHAREARHSHHRAPTPRQQRVK